MAKPRNIINARPSLRWRLASWAYGVDRIHRIQGGLANQMFQYAHAWALQSRWPARTYVELGTYLNASPDRAYQVEEVFEMPDRFPHLSADLEKGIRRWRLHRSDRSEELTIEFKDSYLNNDLRGFIQGYFPSFRYSEGVVDMVRRNFKFRKPLPSRNNQLAIKLLEADAVAVHVRRGDYLKPENKADFFGMCTPAYYRAAIGYVRNRQANAKFYFFSDDPAWCRIEFSDVAEQVVEGNVGEDAWVDMALMARCRSAIIANSSYSLWARWLAGDTGGVNICPSQFFNNGAYGARTDDIFPPSYVRIDSTGVRVSGGDR
jgi:hypothetical protein